MRERGVAAITGVAVAWQYSRVVQVVLMPGSDAVEDEAADTTELSADMFDRFSLCTVHD